MIAIAVPPARRASRNSVDLWYWLISLGCGAALLAFISPTLTELHQRWIGLSFAEGYAIVALAGVLFYREARHSPPVDVPLPSAWGLLLLIAGVGATIVGRAADISILGQAAFPVLLLAVLWSLFGWRACSRFCPSLLFLYFAIPFWQILDFLPFAMPSFNEGLQALTTGVVSIVIRATSVTAFIEGNFVHLPSGTFEIAEGCSGRAFFVVALELALFYGLMYVPRWRRKASLVAIAAALALVSNWVRVYAIVMIGYFSDMQHPLMEDHATFGWVVFLVLVILPMALIGRRLERADVSESGYLSSVTRYPLESELPGSIRKQVALPMLTLTVFIASTLLSEQIRASREGDFRVVPIVLPEFDGWQLGSEWSDSALPVYVEPHAAAGGWYLRAGEQIGVYVAHYAAQAQGREAVYYANQPLGNAVLREVKERRIVTVESAGMSYAFAEWEVIESNARRLVWHGVRVAGRSTANEIAAKLYQIAGALTGRNDAQVLIMSMVCQADCSVARGALSAFSKDGATRIFHSAEEATVALPSNYDVDEQD